MSFQVTALREQFPQLDLKRGALPIVYLDNAATTLKPMRVINRVDQYYKSQVANVHRGAHFLADQGTTLYENARQEVASFIKAKAEEIIFTRGTTESINLVARSYAAAFLKPGDEIILSEMEHHSNLVPWLMISKEKDLKLTFIPVLTNGELDLESYKKLLNSKVKMVALTWVSNVLGTINPIAEIFKMAQANGAITVLDAAQGVGSLPTDVVNLHCDFLAFSGHKIFAPTGIGILYGKKELLNKMPPYQGGGSMINKVTLTGCDFLSTPHRFEAGTPNISGALGLAESIRFLQEFEFSELSAHKKKLLTQTTEGLKSLGLTIYGESKSKESILAFNLQGAHSSDVGQILDEQGIAVRTGHHCCQPLMERLGVSGVVRASFSIYNTTEEVENFLRAIKKAQEILS